MSANIDVFLRLKDQLSGGLQQAMGNTDRSVKLLDTSMKGMVRTFANLGTVVAGGWIGQKVWQSVDRFTKAAAESEIAIAKLNQALGGNTDALVAQSNELSVSLGIDDEAIIRLQALLGGYTKNKDAIMALTPAIIDMAEALGMDMESAARLVGKALRNDNDELAKYKIHVNGAAGSMERAESLASALAAAFGGQAKAANDASDKSKNVAVAFGNVAESIGSEMLPEIRKLNETLATFANNTLVPLGRMVSHLLVDPFRMAAIGAMELSKGVLHVYNAANKLGQRLQKEGSPMWLSYQADIKATDAALEGLEQEIIDTTKLVLGMKDINIINPKLGAGFDVGGGSDKDSAADAAARKRDRDLEETGAHFIKQKEDEMATMLELAEVNKQIAALESEIAAEKEAAIQKHEDIELAASDRREQRMLEEMELRKQYRDFWIDTGRSMYESTKTALDLILKASKASATQIKAVRIAEIWMDAGAASMAAMLSVWSDKGAGNVYQKIAMTIATAAHVVTQAVAATALATKYSYNTGTIYAGGGPTRVHKDETIYLPRGSQVQTARDSRGGGNVSVNVSIGSVNEENVGSVTRGLRNLGNQIEAATRGGFIDWSRVGMAT